MSKKNKKRFLASLLIGTLALVGCSSKSTVNDEVRTPPKELPIATIVVKDFGTIEAELYPTLNDGVNYMFYHTYENVDQIVVGEHVETQEELDEMKRDRDFVLNSGKLDYEDAFRDETD